MRMNDPAMSGLFSSITGAVGSVVSTAVKTGTQIALAPTRLSLQVVGSALNAAKPLIGQATNVAAGAIQTAGQVAGQVGGAAAGAAENILVQAGQGVSAAKGTNVAPAAPTSNLPLYIGGAAAIGLLAIVLLRRPAAAAGAPR